MQELIVPDWQGIVIRFKSDYWHNPDGQVCFQVERQDIPWANDYELKCSPDLAEEIQRLRTKYDLSRWEFEVRSLGDGELVILVEAEIQDKAKDKDEKDNTQLATEEPRLS